MQQIVVMLTLGLLANATAGCEAGASEDEICEKRALCAGASGLDDEAKETFLAECRANLDPMDVALCTACVAERSCSELAEGACSSDCGSQ